MLSGKIPLIIFGLVLLAIGLVSGYGFHASFICPDSNSAIVEQFKKDDKAVKVIEKKAEVRNVEIKQKVDVVKATPTDECFDRSIPDESADLLFDTLQPQRP